MHCMYNAVHFESLVFTKPSVSETLVLTVFTNKGNSLGARDGGGQAVNMRGPTGGLLHNR